MQKVDSKGTLVGSLPAGQSVVDDEFCHSTIGTRAGRATCRREGSRRWWLGWLGGGFGSVLLMLH